jgi:hypothetical protein
MLAKACVFGACFVSVASLVAGCSSDGGKQSTPTNSSATTTTTRSGTSFGGSPRGGTSVMGATGVGNGGGPVGPTGIARTLGACPTHDPTNSPGASLTKLNAGTHGLDQQLVPIEAFAVRICDYIENGTDTPPTRLVASGLLTAPAAQLLANEANRLPKNLGGPVCIGRTTGYTEHVFVLTFASDSRHVVVFAFAGCGSNAGNGKYASEPSKTWLNELQRYTSPYAPPTPPGGTSFPAGLPCTHGGRPGSTSTPDQVYCPPG